MFKTDIEAFEPLINAAAKKQPTLQHLECIIERGKATYLEVGQALYTIKSLGLFKPTYPTWASYLEARWSFSRQHAHRLMQAWTEAETSPTGDIAKTEREARRRRKGKSTRASSKTVSLPDGIVEDLEAELEAVQKQMSRWQKFLSNEDEIFFLEKIAKIVDDRLIELGLVFRVEVGEPLFYELRVLDIDTTIKTIYGYPGENRSGLQPTQARDANILALKSILNAARKRQTHPSILRPGPRPFGFTRITRVKVRVVRLVRSAPAVRLDKKFHNQGKTGKAKPAKPESMNSYQPLPTPPRRHFRKGW
jgi:hypothetical protein